MSSPRPTSTLPVPPVAFTSLGHINIVVDDADRATAYYGSLLGAVPVQDFPRFRNRGFALAAGFLEAPDEVDVSIRFLELPGANVVLELMDYHRPRDLTPPAAKPTYAFGGPRHIALRVRDIDAAFAHVRTHPDTRLIHPSPEYRPFKIDAIEPPAFRFFDPAQEGDADAKARVCAIIGSIRYFYFVDRFGVQWEFEQGHDDIGSTAPAGNHQP